MCGAQQATPSFESEFKPFALATCRVCRFNYLSPRLLESVMTARYQSADYYCAGQSGYDSYTSQAIALGQTFGRVVEQLEHRGLVGGDLLEIGCGFGYFLAQARARFRRLDATEYSPAAAEQARQHADHVYLGGVDSVPGDQRYNLVAAFQVLEHVYRPRSFLQQVKNLLHPGGRVLLGVPDMASPWRRVLGSRWPSFKIPEHVLYFDGHSLEQLMVEAGLKNVRRFPYPHAFPLGVVASKLGLDLSGRMGRLCLWVPRTTVAAIGEV
jgi:2-polyprenyl-3-methyl-5-hydroxy-6-metoxy-1,4-benzoquinol methylase